MVRTRDGGNRSRREKRDVILSEAKDLHPSGERALPGRPTILRFAQNEKEAPNVGGRHVVIHLKLSLAVAASRE
jgi:hypothetical protein